MRSCKAIFTPYFVYSSEVDGSITRSIPPIYACDICHCMAIQQHMSATIKNKNNVYCAIYIYILNFFCSVPLCRKVQSSAFSYKTFLRYAGTYYPERSQKDTVLASVMLMVAYVFLSNYAKCVYPNVV